MTDRPYRTAPQRHFSGGYTVGPILPLEYGRTPLAPRFRSKLSSLLGWVRGDGA